MSSVPILFLVFNRPDTTKWVFEEIRKARPTKLYIAADGPRSEKAEDAAKCTEVRKTVSQIDWPCDVQTLFRERNLGCKEAVGSAINWFFSHVEEGIILEDDCLPNPSFFSFCEEMLARYRVDTKIMMVSGFNITGTKNTTGESYFFSKYGSIWGWATWRRAWDMYSTDRGQWDDLHKRETVRRNIDSGWQWKIKEWTYESVFSGKKNTWDYQWEYVRILKGGLSIIPVKNLIQNIGFGESSTHTTTGSDLSLKSETIDFPLAHPTKIHTDSEYDSLFIEKIFGRENLMQKLTRVLGFKKN